MKVYTLTGKSGTGKSFQAVNLCRQLNIESIIDDGLFICRNKVVAGISAKRQPTKIGAVKTALFTKDEHCESVRRAIRKENPDSILVIGTSDDMVDVVIERLGLPKPEKIIHIEDITTEEEREIASRQRSEQGEHVIPAPTFQLKRQFSGYFMSPMRALKEFTPWGGAHEEGEKSVVRPTYSYLGEYEISEKVLSDIVDCIRREGEGVYQVVKVYVSHNVTEASRMRADEAGDGSAEPKDAAITRHALGKEIDLYVVANLNYGQNLPQVAEDFQKRVAEQVEEMTAFNVNRVDLDIRDVV